MGVNCAVIWRGFQSKHTILLSPLQLHKTWIKPIFTIYVQYIFLAWQPAATWQPHSKWLLWSSCVPLATYGGAWNWLPGDWFVLGDSSINLWVTQVCNQVERCSYYTRETERKRDMEKLGVTAELLQLGKHIEPSGHHIHQHTECQSAAPEGSPASLPRYCYCGAVGRVTGRHLQSRFGPFSPAFGSANVSMHGLGCFYSHFPCPNRLTTGR